LWQKRPTLITAMLKNNKPSCPTTTTMKPRVAWFPPDQRLPIKNKKTQREWDGALAEAVKGQSGPGPPCPNKKHAGRRQRHSRRRRAQEEASRKRDSGNRGAWSAAGDKGKRSSSFRPAWKIWFARSSSPHRLCKGWINLSSL
jgi:hypothetical protein